MAAFPITIHTLSPAASGSWTGGRDTTIVQTRCELYDPVAGIWTLTGSLNVSRYGDAAVLLPLSGRVLIAGTFNGFINQSTELYEPAFGKWTFSRNLMNGGQVLATGGFTFGSTLTSAELYQP